MPIALTVVVAPSRRLRVLLAGAGACLFAAACAVGLAAPAAFTAGPAVAAALLSAALCVAHAALRPAMAHRIDISGPGQLRLTVQQGVRRDETGAQAARLLPGSTCWPRLLMLRFEVCSDAPARPAAGASAHLARLFGRRRGTVCHSLPVLADSLPPEGFRALAVAIGALGRPTPQDGGGVGASSTERKIL